MRACSPLSVCLNRAGLITVFARDHLARLRAARQAQNADFGTRDGNGREVAASGGRKSLDDRIAALEASAALGCGHQPNAAANEELVAGHTRGAAREQRHTGWGEGGEEAAGGQRSEGRASRWSVEIEVDEVHGGANGGVAATCRTMEAVTTSSALPHERQGEAVTTKVGQAKRELECRDLRRQLERQAHESLLLRHELEQAQRERASALGENARLRSQLEGALEAARLYEQQRSRLQHELDACKAEHTKCASQRDKYKRRSVEWLEQIKQIAKGNQRAAAPGGAGGGGDNLNDACSNQAAAEPKSSVSGAAAGCLGSAAASPQTPASNADLPPPVKAKASPPSPVSPRSPAATQPARLPLDAPLDAPWPQEPLPRYVEQGPEARPAASPRDSRQDSPGFSAVDVESSSRTDSVGVRGACLAGANGHAEGAAAGGDGVGLRETAAAPSESPSLGDIFVRRQVQGQEHGDESGAPPGTHFEPGAADGSGPSLGELFGRRTADLAAAAAHVQHQPQEQAPSSQAFGQASTEDWIEELAPGGMHVASRRELRAGNGGAGERPGEEQPLLPGRGAKVSDSPQTRDPLEQSIDGSIEHIKHLDSLLGGGQLMIYKSIYGGHGL